MTTANSPSPWQGRRAVVPASGPAIEGTGVDHPEDYFAAAHLVDWSTFWDRETGEDWLVEPMIPARRATAVAAVTKTGKSLLTLDIAAAFATGRPILGQPNDAGPRHVLYLDYEMTLDDLHDRLEDMGHGRHIDLSHLHYASLPTIEPLDTPGGGQYLLQLAQHHSAELVVIDTLARAVDGEENSADTYRAFFLHTGAPLKNAGITVVRIDHVGHGDRKRARGSSAKGEDVDLVWILEARDDGFRLERGPSRVSWVPSEVNLRRDTEPHLRHVLTNYAAWPAGTKDLAARLDAAGVPLDASLSSAIAELREAGKGARKGAVGKALKYRKVEADRLAERFPMNGNRSNQVPSGTDAGTAR